MSFVTAPTERRREEKVDGSLKPAEAAAEEEEGEDPRPVSYLRRAKASFVFGEVQLRKSAAILLLWGVG
jgi:hypothetical protein